MMDTVTPTFRKDWPTAVAAGFEEINTSSGYRTPTDDFLKGMARSFEQQERDWLYEQERLGTYVSVYDDYRSEWRSVPVAEVAEIEESNKKYEEREARQAEWKAKRKAEKKSKWYRRLLKR